MNKSFFYLLLLTALTLFISGYFFVSSLKTSQQIETHEDVVGTEELHSFKEELEIAAASGISAKRYAEIERYIVQLTEREIPEEELHWIQKQFLQLNVGREEITQDPGPITNEVPNINHEGLTESQVEEQSSSNITSSPSKTEPITEPLPLITTTNTDPDTSCSNNRHPIFTHHITDVSKIEYIVPPPTMGDGQNLKTHSYIGTNSVRVSVYAPTDMTLVTGAHYVGGPYWLGFQISCEISMRFAHITEPIQSIKEVFPSEPSSDSRDNEIAYQISFKAGDIIGYTVGTNPGAGNWDFGVYDSQVRNKYYEDPEWNGNIFHTSVCPFSYFPEAMRRAYTEKFDTDKLEGNPPHGTSFCAEHFE